VDTVNNLPRCMHMITPEQVVEAVLSYCGPTKAEASDVFGNSCLEEFDSLTGSPTFTEHDSLKGTNQEVTTFL
jgi:hypothetical protein